MSDTQKNYLNWLEKLRQREDLLRIFIFTAFTVFCWVGFSIYLSQQRTKIPNEVRKLAIPLNPNIDVNSIQEIESRKYYEDQELNDFPIYIYENDIDGKRNLVQLGQESSAAISSPSAESDESILEDTEVQDVSQADLEVLEETSDIEFSQN